MLLRTLGGLVLEGTSFRRPKPLLLLTYLSLENSKPRRYLAEVFYPETSDPLNSLSRALSFLKTDVPGAFVTEGQRIRTAVECDAKVLLALLDAGRFGEGAGLYTGPFLEGLDLEMGEELEEWVYGTREFLAGRVRDALLRVGELHAVQGRLHDAARSAEAAYAVPGAPELEPENFQRVYVLLATGGSPRASAVRKEAGAFGLALPPVVPPPPLPAAGDQPARPRHNLPRVGTSFVGREPELAELSGQLRGQECRLLTVHGPGGVGKSRLAVELAREHLNKGEFAGGAFFVPLELLAAPELLPVKLAEVLGLDQRGRADVLPLVKAHIGNQAVLLILDNYEHVAGGTFSPTDLLAACPNLKILVTSRERLHLEVEWVYPLGGLPRPHNAGELFSNRPHAQAALQLFLQRAKRARLDFSLTAEELPHVLRVCQLVEGFPLGIELAAAWVRFLSPTEIAREVERDANFLASQAQDAHERHRSVRAVFESSWRRLGAEEQRALRQLSAFLGGFRTAAAAEVVGATIPLLTSLVDKSFLRVDAAGRYDRHGLLHQYMREKLAEHPDEEGRVAAAHAGYYHRFLRQMEGRLRGTNAAAEVAQEELENVRLAWRWVLRRGLAEDVRLSASPLRTFFDRWGRFREGAELFEEALAALRPAEPGRQAALGIVLVEQAWLVFRLGRRGAAAGLAARGLDLLRPLDDAQGLREGLHVLGALKLDAGEYGEARRLWREALIAARESGNDGAVAHSLELLGVVEELSGNAVRAKAHYREALDLSLHLGDKEGLVDTLNNLSALLIDAGDFAEAEPLLRRAAALAREVGAHRVLPYLLDNLAKVAYARGEYERSARLGQEALRMARDSGEKPLEVRVLETLGRTAFAVGDVPAAEAHLKRSLAEAKAMNAVPHVLRVLVRMAELGIAGARGERAAFLLRLVAAHPATSGPDRALARNLLRTLQLPDAPPAAGDGGGDLEQAVRQVLGESAL